ncbi:MAG: DarT ssDNA thymidine ADP-ribosyltransferase family protein [Anaerolineae bacterium]|nr:DarT ssDNA thymidine ADP-ribosyltransferase family protein [Anaerolineae bacterium]
MTSSTLKIFISYARIDGKTLALKLRDDLQAAGLAIWLDLSEIEGGAVWTEKIEAAIEECDLVLALLSHGSYKSEICRAEQLRAIRKGKRMIPLLVQPDADRPLHLEHINYLDFTKSERYSDSLRDLLSDLNAGRAFRDTPLPAPEQPASTLFEATPTKAGVGEKREAALFRRAIADLRQSSWLGARYWWTYFLFYCVDLTEVSTILSDGRLRSTSAITGRRRSRWDDTVRLYFRPRTPDMWSSEGIRPKSQRRNGTIGLPIYLLFDLEGILCRQESRFTDGDPTTTNRTFAKASQFAQMPFELIYHDSFVYADQREEIMQSRRAQVIVPDQLGLEMLQYIWCRSRAEYETLRSILPTDVWRKWRDKITVRTDYTLFYRRWTYVEDTLLTAESVQFQFHPAAQDADRQFSARLTVISDDQRYEWFEERWIAQDEWIFTLPQALPHYTVRLELDDTVAYQGEFRQSDGLI